MTINEQFAEALHQGSTLIGTALVSYWEEEMKKCVRRFNRTHSTDFPPTQIIQIYESPWAKVDTSELQAEEISAMTSFRGFWRDRFPEKNPRETDDIVVVDED